MKAVTGSRIEFTVLPVDDDPAGEIHAHHFMPHAPDKPVIEDGQPTPGYMVTLTNLGPKVIFIDTAYPYMELALSSGPLIGRSTTHFDLECTTDSGSRMPEPLKPGQSVTVYRQLENLGATIRGKTLQCRLVLDVTGMVNILSSHAVATGWEIGAKRIRWFKDDFVGVPDCNPLIAILGRSWLWLDTKKAQSLSSPPQIILIIE